MTALEKGYALLRDWKGGDFVYGPGVFDQLGALTAKYGKRVMIVSTPTYKALTDRAMELIAAEGGIVVPETIVPGARPNAPREDVFRIETYILHYQPDVVVSIGGGSTIDAVKAAIVMASLGGAVTPELDPYFGTGVVTKTLEETGRTLIPHIAVETASSSGSHLTKYSNVTDPVSGQKLLIVDNAIVPQAALFDYNATKTMPKGVTIEGALDGISHTVEVFWGAKPETYERTKEICETALELIIANTKAAIDDPNDKKAREALGVATDLGGYAIMVGGTSGGHMTSFSLVDVAAHGTACGIMNPYYAVLYSPAIQPQLLVIGNVLKKYGFVAENVALEALEGRNRAIAVAEGLHAFCRSIGAPVTLGELPGFSEEQVDRILTAAKNPQLKMKLQNMPIPLTADDVDTCMAPVIRAAVTGDFTGIPAGK